MKLERLRVVRVDSSEGGELDGQFLNDEATATFGAFGLSTEVYQDEQVAAVAIAAVASLIPEKFHAVLGTVPLSNFLQ